MSIITRMEAGKRNKERYNIYVDDEFLCALDGELVIKFHLKPGMEVNAAQIKAWAHEDQAKKSFDRALGYLGYRPRSRKEIRDYLAGKDFDEDVIDQTLRKLKEYNFINDEDFADRWVNNRMSGKPMGKRMIAYELRNKGVSDSTVEKALDKVSADAEDEQALKMAEKYYRRYKSLDRREMTNKMGQAMARRGFDWDVIQRAVRHCLEDSDMDDNL